MARTRSAPVRPCRPAWGRRMLQRGDPMCRHLGATMGQSVGTRNEWSRQSNGRDCFKCHPGRLPGIARIVPPMPHKRGGGTEHAMANGRAETEAPRGAMNPEEATEILSSCERTHKTDHPAPSLDQNERSPRASGAASLVWSRQMPVRHGVAPKRERMSRFCRTRQLGQVALRRVVRPA